MIGSDSIGLERFDRYADDEQKDSILDEGIEQFYTELGVDTQACVATLAIVSYRIVSTRIVSTEGWGRRLLSRSVLSVGPASPARNLCLP